MPAHLQQGGSGSDGGSNGSSNDGKNGGSGGGKDNGGNSNCRGHKQHSTLIGRGKVVQQGTIITFWHV
jgi:hypothetical protein